MAKNLLDAMNLPESDILDAIEEEKELTPEQAEEIAAEPDLARIAQILSTGPTTSQVRMIMDLIPPDRHGFLCRERAGDLHKVSQLGYRIETTDTLPGAKGLHTAGDNRIRVGDVILVTTSKKNIENIRKAEKMLVLQKLQMGEKEYDKLSEGNPLVPVFNEGTTYVVKK